MTVDELQDLLDTCPGDAEVVAHTEFTAVYGEGVWVHIGAVEEMPDGTVVLGESFS